MFLNKKDNFFPELMEEAQFYYEVTVDYEQVPLPSDASIQTITRTMHTLSNGIDIGGYIANDTIYYVRTDEIPYGSNPNKWFSFATFNLDKEPTRLVPSSYAILIFLKSRTNQVMFIVNEYAIYLEKTLETYEICEKLNEIYESDKFYNSVLSVHPELSELADNMVEDEDEIIEDVKKENNIEFILPALLCTYEYNRCGGTEAKTINFDEDYMQILTEMLKVKVEVILLE